MKTLFIVVGIVLICAGAFYTFNSYIYNEKQGEAQLYEPYRATLTGEQVCLSHKDTSGPQTMECALGIKTDGGEYYALDLSLMSQTSPTIPSGARFTANGTITPLERLSTDHWQKYEMVGIFSVTDGVEVESEEPAPVTPTPTTPAPVAAKPCFVGGCSSQVCSDQEGMVSTCEYRPEYSCYQGATCERQASGQCGWTQTPALKACLMNPPTE